MNEYMRALRERFTDGSLHSKEREALEAQRQALAGQLDARQQDLLMDLVDAETLLREHMALEHFISGFRLAYGIAKELSVEPPYSLDPE